LLLSLFPTEGKATLIGEYDNINSKTKIKYTCSNCDIEEEKPFSRLYACSTFCRKCTYKRGSEAAIKTLQQKYGSHVKNAMDVPELVEKINNTIKKNYGEDIRIKLGKNLAESRKVQWEKQKTNWKEIEDKGTMKCRTCKVQKNLDCFQKGIREYNTWNTQCYSCKNIKRASNRQEWSKNAPIEEILEELLKAAKRRVKQKDKYKCSITLEELKEIYTKQSGKCYISGKQMQTNVGSPDRISLDRIDSNKGYTKDNVGLTCIQVNIMKMDLGLEVFANYIKNIYEYNSIFKYINNDL
jgi:hypothetical protein